ncbi:beta-ketoacyl synthase chain length factor [Salegentibacter salarius]|uniref:3-oxoacyl-ACP synthase n=1 Tax=Salegentibacter salarius TaxID=435906 RepID=A0A2N0TTR1_9FLAO|nr:beta-ketoacyl synthase chain length factor [Salegentibacter salarius]OEY72427.1 3-oxoacyl-ACP synthase [Salegentibacter salarius]PKD18132.1 3-oxoacyl-ACP synthase [Salegentibacter salarius]SLK03301.1 Beta-ketoacyl synthase, N-terminal domain [Salegentibacter salarius]
MKAKIYINGISSISAQNLDSEANPVSYHKTIFPAISPNYKEFIKPMALRRMSKAIKMGITSAKVALSEAKIEIPDAIITGTGEGCKQDTERFLENLLDQDEELLSPTSFIQSTHNTIGGQIALNLGCKNYNVTYTQNSASLESAFLDAEMQLLETSENKSVLVGGVDELSEKITQFKSLDGQLKSVDIHNLDLLKEDSPGTITSEGSHFFTLSTEKNNNSYAEFKDVSIKNSIQPEKINEEVEIFLIKNNINAAAIDAVIFGNNGDNRYDHYYKNLQQNLFKNTTQLAYKHLVGDYDTVSGFALYSACKILKNGRIPSIMNLNSSTPKKLKNILIYNQYLGRDHSLILLSAV